MNWKIRTCVSLFCIIVILSGCAGMVKTTKVVDGKKVTMWVNPETAKRMEEEERLEAERMERIKMAEKRKPDDPIIVALFETEVEENLKKNVQGRLFEQFRSEFKNDKIIRLLDQKTVNRAAQSTRWNQTRFSASSKSAPSVSAHVSVLSQAYVREVPGYNKKTGKIGTMAELVLTATISSNFVEKTYKIEEKGNIFNNVKVTQDFASKIKNVIKSEIGPNLPAKAFGTLSEGEQAEAISKWLESLSK